ncbi:MAG: type IV pilus secretin PilQ [Deltaproteobacteria bacterium]|nr:type IV pilus secretin PilQ [Deltaproteobacteria bacterium]NCS74539.1 type IV pilus secretin PilQ [Deltaproteobacteria bacterium]
MTLVTKAPVIYRVLNWQQGGVEVDLYDVLLGQYDAQTIKVGDGVVDQLEVSSYGQGKRTMARLLIRTPSPVTVDAQRDKDGLVLTLNQGGAPAVAKGGDKGGDIDTLIQQVQEHHPVAAGGEAVGSAAEPGAAEPGAGATAEVAAADNGREELIVSTVHFTGRKMSLDFQDASITSVLRLIADTAGINMVFGKDVDGKVTMQLKNIPWDQALDIVLKTNSLGMKKEGGVYRVAKLEALQQEEEQHMAVKRSKEKAEDLERAILSINYANAKELSGVIKELLSTRGKMDVDVRTNTIIVKDIRSVVEEAKQVVEHLDLATPQVSIEARIVEATTNFAKELGVQWGGHFKAGPTTGNPTGLDFPHTIGLVGTADSTNGFAVNLPTTKTATGGIGLTLGSLTNALFLDLRLSALEESGEAKVIASPRVTTLDNQEAIIKQGDEIPFQSTSANQGTQTQFKEALLQLKVTPHITSNKKVILNIVASKDTPDFANAVNGQPAISKQEASTQVLLANHETTVIGGIYSIIEEDANSRIPFLSRIPWAGNLFKNHKHKRDRKELLIFITPRIVDEGV